MKVLDIYLILYYVMLLKVQFRRYTDNTYYSQYWPSEVCYMDDKVGVYRYLVQGQ
jgi:hypothetical protein